MRLTRHREEFNLGMSSEDVNNLAALLKGYRSAVTILRDDHAETLMAQILDEFIYELTKYQREAYAYDQWLAEQEMGSNRTM